MPIIRLHHSPAMLPHVVLAALVFGWPGMVAAQQPTPRGFSAPASFDLPELSRSTRDAIGQAARKADLIALVNPWVRAGDYKNGWVCCALLAVYKGNLDPEHQLLWIPQSLLPDLHTRRGSCGQLLALAADPDSPGGWQRVNLPRNLPPVPSAPVGWLNEFEQTVKNAGQPVVTPAFIPAQMPATMPVYTPVPVQPRMQMTQWIDALDTPGPAQQEAMISLAKLGEEAMVPLLKAAASDRWERAKRAKQLLGLLDGGSAWQGLRLRLIGPTQQALRVRDRVTFTIELVNLSANRVHVDGGRPGAFMLHGSNGVIPPIGRQLQSVSNLPQDWVLEPFGVLSVPVEARLDHCKENGDVLSLITPLGSPPVGKNKAVSVEVWFQDPGPVPEEMGRLPGDFIGPQPPPRPARPGKQPLTTWPGGRLRSNTVEVRIEP